MATSLAHQQPNAVVIAIHRKDAWLDDSGVGAPAPIVEGSNFLQQTITSLLGLVQTPPYISIIDWHWSDVNEDGGGLVEESKVLITVEEAARRLSIGRSHVYELLQRQQLASVKLGKSRRIPLTALDEFVSRL